MLLTPRCARTPAARIRAGGHIIIIIMAAAAPPWAAIDAQFAREPLAVFARIADVALAYCKVRFASNRGEILRAELSRLGPVFCKVCTRLASILRALP